MDYKNFEVIIFPDEKSNETFEKLRYMIGTIIFTRHARLRMAQRDINEAEVIYAIEHPDEVVGRIKGKNIIVITVYWC